MKLSRLIIFAVLLVFGLNTVNAQSSGTSVSQANYPNGPVFKFSFTNVDSLTLFGTTTKGLDVGLLSADTNYITWFTNIPAGDTTRATFFGQMEYDSAGQTKVKWDSCFTQLIVGATDSNQVKQAKIYWYKYYSTVRIRLSRPSSATVPILPSRSDRVYYFTISAKRMNYLPPWKSFNIQIPNN